MFLITLVDILNKFIDWVEKHPQMTSIITTIIPCICITGFLGFVFKAKIEERNKRIVAETSLFPKLKKEIIELNNALSKNDRLDSSASKMTNIFLMLYPYDRRKEDFRNFVYNIPSIEHNHYVKKCAAIKRLLSESDCNVPPKKTDKKEWYDNQDVLLLFCDFISDMDGQDSSCSDYYGPLDSLSHISKCEELNNAIKFMIEKLSYSKDK